MAVTNEILAEICPDKGLHNLPIARFVADMQSHMDSDYYPDPKRFRIYKDGANLTASVSGAAHCIEGYNYPYQVKLVMDAITEAGFFK